ncbi:centromere protein Chl4/mis15/CENP-N [Lineolata rhizophorae]|uniref:Centromere protein Chl4/mis15/CENP-N n=1 Tax=Lineolata rhizophorae TaxID=578093 RepID=A0A6A6PCF8_9PEZI|nr:centromere protein Chl4/mis15/CENP-N [Lineolata rhizophorae]
MGEAGELGARRGDVMGKSVLIALRFGSPHVFLAEGQLGQSSSRTKLLKSAIIAALPRVLSRPGTQYKLRQTNLVTTDLDGLERRRGPGRSNAAPAGWRRYATDSSRPHLGATPLGSDLRDAKMASKSGVKTEAEKENTGNKDEEEGQEKEEGSLARKRRKLVADGRFGAAEDGDDLMMQRFDAFISDPFPAIQRGGNSGASRPQARNETSAEQSIELPDWAPDVRLSFQGTHLFAGMRQLVEEGVVDGRKMPGWMTGEADVSVGAVKDGRMKTWY